MSQQKPMVLFLCTGNSCRSQMAEALLRHFAGDHFEVRSAGISPTEVHPLTLRVIAERGIETSQLSAKPISAFLGRAAVRYAIVVCERAQQNCPRIFPFALHNMYWPFDDPAAMEGSESDCLAKFRAVRDQIERRIKDWIDSEEPLRPV